MQIFSPINKINDINVIAENTNCTNIYIYYSEFLKCEENEAKYLLLKYLQEAQKHNLKLFINFKKIIEEDKIENLKHFIQFLTSTSIDGIMINSYAVLEVIKNLTLPFKVYIDSGLNIHNLSGIEFVNLFHTADNINITEEIYIKNIQKIKKYTNVCLSIDTDNLPWIANDIIKSNMLDALIIKGSFSTVNKLIKGIKLIESILENPENFKNKKLPFRNSDTSVYKSNHFSGEILSSESKDFKFRGNIQQFEWKFKRTRTPNISEIDIKNIPKINLRLTSLEQFKVLKKYIRNIGFNPVYSIEYGEIMSTADLAKQSFNNVLSKVKKDCALYGIKLQLSTPRILIERDFDRVYEYVKSLCISAPQPESVIVNNIGYWWAIANDNDFKNINIEIGNGLNLSNSFSIQCLAKQKDTYSIDLSAFKSIVNLQSCIEDIKDTIPNRKMKIAGSIRVPSLGLCPLNTDSAILSRLSCAAPCHSGTYAIFDPSIEKTFPFTVDGFCRMHLFKDKILDLFKYVNVLQNAGVNEFVIDFNGLPANLVTVLLNRFLNSLNDKAYQADENFTVDKYQIIDDIQESKNTPEFVLS